MLKDLVLSLAPHLAIVVLRWRGGCPMGSNGRRSLSEAPRTSRATLELGNCRGAVGRPIRSREARLSSEGRRRRYGKMATRVGHAAPRPGRLPSSPLTETHKNSPPAGESTVEASSMEGQAQSRTSDKVEIFPSLPMVLPSRGTAGAPCADPKIDAAGRRRGRRGARPIWKPERRCEFEDLIAYLSSWRGSKLIAKLRLEPGDGEIAGVDATQRRSRASGAIAGR